MRNPLFTTLLSALLLMYVTLSYTTQITAVLEHSTACILAECIVYSKDN